MTLDGEHCVKMGLCCIACWAIGLFIIRALIKLSNGICKSDVCLNGKTAIVTGGNSGIGYQTALNLAMRGCRVIIASPGDERVKDKIVKETKNPDIVTKHLDLGSIESVRKFAKEINEEEERLDILINNAGTGGLGNQFTADDLQIGMQINHFGPFLLTHLLIDLLKKSAPSRIVFVSSFAAFDANLTLENLNNPYGSRTPGSTIKQDSLTYSNTKLCNIITSNGFAEKLRGTGISCNSLHPGVVKTAILTTTFLNKLPEFLRTLVIEVAGVFIKSPREGAQTTLHVALSNELDNVTGEYFLDCRKFFKPSAAKDAEFCEKIWKKSEDLVKLTPNERLK